MVRGGEARGRADEDEDDDEPGPCEQVGEIVKGAAATGVAYGALRLVCSTATAEDVLDMMHSLATCVVSFRGMASMELHPVHTRVLPVELARGRGPVVRMFSLSLGYFMADVLKIMVDVLARRKYPRLWVGRLLHHIVQLGASSPAIFGRGVPRAQTMAWRSVLCMAYTAEISSVFLRLSNIIRERKVSPMTRMAVNWSLVISFFGSRVVNFARAIAMFIRARELLPPRLFWLGATVQAAGYALSAAWFTKIFRIALKSSGESLPSLNAA